MSIDEYYQEQLRAISASPYVQTYETELDKRGPDLGLIRGEVRFLDGSLLQHRELIDFESQPPVSMYSYHYQGPDSSLIFRYEDTRHHAGLPGFPHHKHVGEEQNVIPTDAPALSVVLHEIETILQSG